MKFRIIAVTPGNHEKLVFVQNLEPEIHFQLSETCFLDGVAIKSTYHLPPRTTDENGNPLKDVYTFELRTKTDKATLVADSIVELQDRYYLVKESYITVSGHFIGAFLQCNTGMLPIGTILQSPKELKWRISGNSLLIGRKSDTKLQEKIREEYLYQYHLDPIDHSSIPEVGTQLILLENAG